jgi:hypothetical protein
MMRLMPIAEEHVAAALRHAEIEQYDNGMLAVTVPGTGTIVTAADQHTCAAELYRRLQVWVQRSLERGWSLPVFDGIDLNVDAERVLATFQPMSLPETTAGREIYEDEEQLETAFRELERSS